MKCHNAFHAGLLLEYSLMAGPSLRRRQLNLMTVKVVNGLKLTGCCPSFVKVGRRAVTEYLVKWEGYGDEYNEWRDEVGVVAAATDESWLRVGHALRLHRI